ncbi:hypothetical protein VPH35_021306 [Triticum aestivum]
MDVTFRESEPFYGEKTDLSGSFESLDHTQSTVISQEGESGGDGADSGVDLVLQQPIEGDIAVVQRKEQQPQEMITPQSEGLIVTEGVPSQAGDAPTQIGCVPRWMAEQEEQLNVYSRKQGDASHRWQNVNEERNPQVYSRRKHHVQGEQQGSNASSSDIEDLPIALRKCTRAKAGIPEPKYGFDANDIGNYVSYEALSLAHKAFVASLQLVSLPTDWKASKVDP